MNYIGQHLVILPSVDSTNNYAMAQARAGLATHGQAWLAVEQTAGKGQLQKTWQADPGANITLSIALKPVMTHQQQFVLSAAIALGTCDFFSEIAGNETRIKWPNDIYWRDRKAGGILIENIISHENNDGCWKWCIVGIGINVNQTRFEGIGLNAVSLLQITRKKWDILVLTKNLCECIQTRYEQLSHPALLLAAYNHFLYKRGACVRLKKENRVFDAVIKSVTSTGELLATTAIEEVFSFGEIQWV